LLKWYCFRLLSHACRLVGLVGNEAKIKCGIVMPTYQVILDVTSWCARVHAHLKSPNNSFHWTRKEFWDIIILTAREMDDISRW
jgi:hypothetical protein